MSNKVIHEIRVVETEDGYTIEMKGDKEVLRDLIFSPRGMNLYGMRPRRGRHSRQDGKHRHRGHAPKHQRRWGRSRGRRGHDDHAHEERRSGEKPGIYEYDLGPWLASEATDEATNV